MDYSRGSIRIGWNNLDKSVIYLIERRRPFYNEDFKELARTTDNPFFDCSFDYNKEMVYRIKSTAYNFTDSDYSQSVSITISSPSSQPQIPQPPVQPLPPPPPSVIQQPVIPPPQVYPLISVSPTDVYIFRNQRECPSGNITGYSVMYGTGEDIQVINNISYISYIINKTNKIITFNVNNWNNSIFYNYPIDYIRQNLFCIGTVEVYLKSNAAVSIAVSIWVEYLGE